MEVINQGQLYKIIKASQNRRNENAEGDRKREYAKQKYVKYFSTLRGIFAGSSGGETSE